MIVIPEGFKPKNGAVDLVVHFHGWNNDNLGVLEKYRLPQQLAASRRNAVLVLTQGPWHAQDSGAAVWRMRADSNGWWRRSSR